LLRRIPDRGAMHRAEEQLVFVDIPQAYRIDVRLPQAMLDQESSQPALALAAAAQEVQARQRLAYSPPAERVA
jgi:hypothetical protein